MVKVLAVGRAQSGVGWEHIAPYVSEEARRVWELYESDRAREFIFVQTTDQGSC